VLLNAGRALALLARHRVDAVVATGPENVTYASDLDTLTHHVQRLFRAAVVLPARPWHPVLVFPVVDLTYAYHRPSWIGDLRTYGQHNVVTSAEVGSVDLPEPADRNLDRLLRRSDRPSGFVQALAGAVRDLGLATARLAVEWAGLSEDDRSALGAALPGAELVDGAGLWREIRLVKTDDELARLRRAVAANEAGFRAALGLAGPGATERALERAYRRAVSEQDASPMYWDSGVGSGSYAFRPSSDRPAVPGDLVRVDASCVVDRYWSDLGRSSCVGDPSAKAADYHGALLQGVRAAIMAAGPGVRPSALRAVVIERVRTAGIPHYRRTHVGHGIGLEFYEPPSLVADADTPLEVGTVLNVEAPYYEIGFGGLQVEETIRITPDGCDQLSALPCPPLGAPAFAS
jgi:Xaa-Pro aminopeptidase